MSKVKRMTSWKQAEMIIFFLTGINTWKILTLIWTLSLASTKASTQCIDVNCRRWGSGHPCFSTGFEYKSTVQEGVIFSC